MNPLEGYTYRQWAPDKFILRDREGRRIRTTDLLRYVEVWRDLGAIESFT